MRHRVSVMAADRGARGTMQWQRLLLSGGLIDPQDGRRTVRDWAVDVALFAVAVVFGVYVLSATWSEHSAALAAVDVVAGTVACLALWVRRRHPIEVGLVVTVAAAVSGLANGAALPALFNAAIRAPLRWLIALEIAAVAGTAVFPTLYPQGPHDRGYAWQVVVGLALNALVTGWGLFVRAQRQLWHALRERALRAEADQQRRALEGRRAERQRIAREMHDVLAHRLSILSVHAGALQNWASSLPPPLVDTADVIRTSAHAALDELRDVIGVLRDSDADDGEGVEPPQPTIERIPMLIEESRAVGLRVTYESRVRECDIPVTIGRTAYRVVQEGLTNARKHGGGAVSVSVRADRRAVDVALVSAPPLRPQPPTQEAQHGAGSGLIGVAERVELAGGRLHHGRDARGDFVLRATIPFDDKP
jgi:signal transduction histidine kinase